VILRGEDNDNEQAAVTNWIREGQGWLLISVITFWVAALSYFINIVDPTAVPDPFQTTGIGFVIAGWMILSAVGFARAVT